MPAKVIFSFLEETDSKALQINRQHSSLGQTVQQGPLMYILKQQI